MSFAWRINIAWTYTIVVYLEKNVVYECLTYLLYAQNKNMSKPLAVNTKAKYSNNVGFIYALTLPPQKTCSYHVVGCTLNVYPHLFCDICVFVSWCVSHVVGEHAVVGSSGYDLLKAKIRKQKPVGTV